ncbi:MAG: SIR2 family protein [Chlorobiales bacterium]|nr:SIR2 family protein [Chlorobiales bacterium]
MSEFISHYVQNAPQFMWFLGAGTSRTAGMPTASDITWDLKRRYYCLQENQDIRSHDLNNKAVKDRIQRYLDSQGFPALWSAEEYSFYFELIFGKDYAAQQKYLVSKLSPQNISLNIGHRALAALIDLGLTRMVFTTNFDEVLEVAFSNVAEKSLTAYHLEGSYAALEALNRENFPIYCKLHGDFRYQSIKNLSGDLRDNDKQIEKCFLAASNRYGMVVSGYSGRDKNVMAMFHSALEQSNPFPQGLYWTTTSFSAVSDHVRDLVAYALDKNVRAEIIETGTFDIMLSKIWRQVPSRSDKLDARVRTAEAKPVCIPRSQIGIKHPILRMNALQICEIPETCGSIEFKPALNFNELNEIKRSSRPNAIITCAEKTLFWGSSEEVSKLFATDRIKSISSYPLCEIIRSKPYSTFLHSFIENALSEALCYDKPLMLRKKGRFYFAVVDHEKIDDPRLDALKKAVGFGNASSTIVGNIPGRANTLWAEALEMKVERRDEKWWLLIEPDIWVSPLSERKEVVDFLGYKRSKRYNVQAFNILNAWIELLCGFVGHGEKTIFATCYGNTDYPAQFSVNTRTAYSRRRGASG